MFESKNYIFQVEEDDTKDDTKPGAAGEPSAASGEDDHDKVVAKVC